MSLCNAPMGSIVVASLLSVAEGAGKANAIPPSLKLDFATIKTPQLIGIIVGVVVFSVTITTVFFLLCKSGSWKKFMSEMADSNSLVDSKSGLPLTNKEEALPSLTSFPELYDNLIQASNCLSAQLRIGLLEGDTISVRPLEASDVPILFESCNGAPLFDESAYDPLRIWGWTVLEYVDQRGNAQRMKPPTGSLEEFSDYLYKRGPRTNLCIMHNIYKKPIGMISMSNNTPLHLCIEIDHIWVTPAWQGKKIAHEAALLLLRELFEQGYRRVSAETDTRHVIYRKFLTRCGFELESVLRKHRIVSNRNRDTAVYTMLNSDWVDCELKMKKHLGISTKPVMHNAIEIDSGKEVEKHIRNLKLAKERATPSSEKVSDNEDGQNRKGSRTKKNASNSK